MPANKAFFSFFPILGLSSPLLLPFSPKFKVTFSLLQVRDLLALQGARLWDHGPLHEEALEETSEVVVLALKEPPEPSLDLQQLRAIKAEFRALVPAIHEVNVSVVLNKNPMIPMISPSSP